MLKDDKLGEWSCGAAGGHPRKLKQFAREVMARTGLLSALSSIGIAALVLPASAEDVTPQRLLNAAGEQQNWLMVHHDYDKYRPSPLREVNPATAKGLNLKLIASIRGGAG